MSYQVIARKFRPHCFEEVVGQDAIVKTLKNALKSGNLAHAYLFCGLRGTGKTTLARLLAKALNCTQLKPTMDPCETCSSCQDFSSGKTLDFIEIDGASHRGIDDVKSIVETLGYASLHRYKIILIDEVHMLTKEAFNALLKTLEEPPPQVKFIFATTEPHKLPPTILSRCLRFDLVRIPDQALVGKLKKVAQSLAYEVEEGILELIAERAEGSLRDAESLLEKLLSGTEQKLTLELAYDLLGYFTPNLMTTLDEAIATHDLKAAFLLTDQLMASGKDGKVFFEQFRQHLRHILCTKLNLVPFTKNYPLEHASIENYSVTLLTYLIELLTSELKNCPMDRRLDIEALLILLIQSASRSSLVDIVEKLEALSKALPEQKSLTPSSRIEEHSQVQPQPTPAPLETTSLISPVELPESAPKPAKSSQFYDTLLQFTAVELEGSLKK